ncbi:MAG TPA: ubiquinol-cytochrome c reductase cytochrome b subunit [Acidimicrobiales bacterium]|nr:ubiquinol-cytochrome c reductase cytochrome b subunit [Acidimicrobiales bacterium]
MGLVRRWVWRTVDRHRPKPVQRTRAEVRRRLPTPRAAARTAVDELDDRVGVAGFGRQLADKIFPDHWSFFLGEIALYAFVVLVLTGIFLTLYYVPSSVKVVYQGPYRPLDGVTVSKAYASVMTLSFGVRAGLFMRQLHHWAADIFIGAIVVHMARVFFTSAYRKPRELNWGIGVTLLMLVIVNGYLGYSLPDDLLSGTGVRIGYGIVESIPFVGSYLAFWIFGGNFPGPDTLHRFYIAHVFIIPLLLLGLLSAHLALIFRQEHTQWPGKGRTEKNVVGLAMWPTFVAKTTGLFLMVTGVLGVMGGVAQIDPVWQYGSYDPSKASAAAQPDWYTGWLEGALRLMPGWEWTGLGHTEAWVTFVPAVALPIATFGLLYAWPYLELQWTGDRDSHHLLVPPRRRPRHTAAGAAVFAFYFMLLFTGGDDVIAQFLGISLPVTLTVLRVAVLVVPTIVGAMTWRICRDLTVGRPRRGPATRATVGLTAGGYYEARAEPVAEEKSLEPVRVPDVIVGGPDR